MKKLVIAVVFLFATSISAGELTEKQKNKQKIIHSVSALDAITTIIGVSKGFVESSSILGPSPDPATVIVFFVARNVVHELVTPMIPDKWRNTWQNSWIGAQSIVVLRNISIITK